MNYVMIFSFINSFNKYFHELGVEDVIVKKAIMVTWNLVKEADINQKLPT